MQRRRFVTATALGGAALGAAASVLPMPAIAQSMPEIKWRLASSFPKSLPTLFGGAEYFCNKVAAATDNKFQIHAFAGGEIVPPLQVLDAVQNGTVECGQTAPYYYVGKDPTFGFACTVPFGFNARQQQAWMLQGGGLELFNEFTKDYNVNGLHRRQHRRADGRLVPPGAEIARRHEGAEVPHRRPRGSGDRETGRRAAADRRRRHLSGAGEGHHRRRRMGGPVRRRAAWASTRSRSSTTTPAGGRGTRRSGCM